MAEEKYNRKNLAVKRILQEFKEMQSNPSDDFMSLPLEENIFEWQFAIRGLGDTEFEGGIYHGRIQLPADYPFKPPSFMLLTPLSCSYGPKPHTTKQKETETERERERCKTEAKACYPGERNVNIGGA